MTPKLVFWTYALVVFCGLVGCASLAFREIRRGSVERHRRFMNAAVLLVVIFVLSYVCKLLLLGREDFSLWSPAAVVVLRIHEALVTLMILAGGIGRFLTRGVPRHGTRDQARAALPPAHRWLGRVALISGALALLTATMVWVGMLERNGVLPGG